MAFKIPATVPKSFPSGKLSCVSLLSASFSVRALFDHICTTALDLARFLFFFLCYYHHRYPYASSFPRPSMSIKVHVNHAEMCYEAPPFDINRTAVCHFHISSGLQTHNAFLSEYLAN